MEVLGIAFELGIPWKNYWDMKSAMNWETLTLLVKYTTHFE